MALRPRPRTKRNRSETQASIELFVGRLTRREDVPALALAVVAVVAAVVAAAVVAAAAVAVAAVAAAAWSQAWRAALLPKLAVSIIATCITIIIVAQ